MSGAMVIALPQNGSATADITLAPAHLAQVSGIAFGSNGRPVPVRCSMSLMATIFSVWTPWRCRFGHDGRFIVIGLPPGTYFLQFREGDWPPPRNIIPKVSSARVNISDADVTRVRDSTDRNGDRQRKTRPGCRSTYASIVRDQGQRSTIGLEWQSRTTATRIRQTRFDVSVPDVALPGLHQSVCWVARMGDTADSRERRRHQSRCRHLSGWPRPQRRRSRTRQTAHTQAAVIKDSGTQAWMSDCRAGDVGTDSRLVISD